ncbi:MAG: nicotinate-nucleotide adenylyltransferase [Rhodobacter sp.]|nr:nicotinate-nucleotide adenylyltransferase [Rhodobacter sp.]
MTVNRHPRAGIPRARPGQTIGLLGGSFDPPHPGHVHITKAALQRFGLDRVWWLVSPGNPLKAEGPAPLERRMAAARAVMDHPKVVVSDVEARLGTRYTAETLRGLMRLYPGIRFVWLMGADNLASFHEWQQWGWIMQTVPIGVLARPGDRTAARCSKAAARYRNAMLRGRDSRLLTVSQPPCWCFINVPMVDVSSSDIRARGEWVR